VRTYFLYHIVYHISIDKSNITPHPSPLPQGARERTGKEIKMKITYWSDYACPYCYIGEKRLETAISELGLENDIDIEMRAFELDPKERSLFRITNNNENTLVRFMFYRFNPNVTNNYAWILKKNFNDSEYGYLVFVLYVVNSVHVLFIPARDIIRPSNDAMILNIFESRDYEGKKSAPEWGINLNYGIINFLIAHYEAK
jgi:hypothetical protein